MTGPVRVDLMHISMQHSDTPKQQAADANKLFARARARGVWWVTGTEADASDDSARYAAGAENSGYRYFRAGDVWIGLDPGRAKGDISSGWTKVIDGIAGRYPNRGVLRVTFTNPDLGRISVLASHFQTSKYAADNATIARAVGELAEQWGTGTNLVFYGGDQNIGDHFRDTFFGQPLTSAWDELGKWEATHDTRTIDVIASYDGDTRPRAIYCHALDDSEFSLNTDHFLVEAGYSVAPL